MTLALENPVSGAARDGVPSRSRPRTAARHRARLQRIALGLLVASWALLGCSGGGSGSSAPSGLRVAGGAWSAWGSEGGPFAPASATFTLSNLGEAPLDWAVSSNVGWLSLSQSLGTLDVGASEQVVAALNVLAEGLAPGSYGGTLTFLNTTDGLGNTSRSVSLTVSSEAGAPMTTASRTSGVAPLAVCFDAVGGASAVVQPPSPGLDYGSMNYRWSFGDPGSGSWTIGGKSKNSATGYVAAHVFETPGEHRVGLQVKQADGTVHDYHQDITVLDPNVVYAGQTYYVSLAGDDGNNGLSPGAPLRTISRAMTTLFASNGPRRVLFRRGDTWTFASTITATGREGPYTIGAYGTGASPVLRATHSGAGLDLRPSVRDVRIVDVDFTGPHPSPSDTGVQLGRDSLLLRSTVRGFATAVGGYDSLCIGNTVADCVLLDNGSYGLYYAPAYNPNFVNDPPYHLAVLGTRFDNSIGNSLLRTYVSRSVWQANLFQRAGQSSARLLGIHAPKKAEFVSITDNVFQSLQTWVLEIGPENTENGGSGGVQQVVENVVVEGNAFVLPGPGIVSVYLLVWGRHVSVRNNVFDLTGAAWGSGMVVERRGIGPVPVGTRIEHNTLYRGDGAPTFQLVDATTQDLTAVRNNIVYSPAVAATVATGTVSAQGNLTVNPLFQAAAQRDFRLQAGSPAIDQGVTLPVRSDFDGNERPLGPGHDIGAFERP
ncbi:MAG: hypothetical protein JNK02_03965 [Planctomycetes bacterium]|nr:hypothetical protein [Planctomycetota bacterium]